MTSPICSNLVYEEVELKTHGSLKLCFFRIVFENIPQWFLTRGMLTSIRKSSLGSCQMSDAAFSISTFMNTVSLVKNFISFTIFLLKKFFYGDLVMGRLSDTLQSVFE